MPRLGKKAIKKSDYGKWAEDKAASFLAQNGWNIIKRNFRCKNGEIDIIAKKAKTLVFVEVKARRSSDFGYSAEFVDKRKQRRIIDCARYFLVKEKIEDVDVRFDIIGIEKENIDWIENAFLED